VVTVLFDLAEDFIDAAWILADKKIFQHKGVGFSGPVPNFPVSHDALVGIHLHNSAVHGGVRNIGKTNIGDLLPN
jgi:hypothetical protein